MASIFVVVLSFSLCFSKRLFLLDLLLMRSDCIRTMLFHPNPSNLPAHLQELCDLLARGLFRLRSRDAEELARQTDDQGDNSLRDTAPQRRHANPTSRRRA